MFRFALILSFLATPVLAQADSKEESCGYQGAVAAAVQQARLDRVNKDDVASTIAAGNPAWPERYNKAIPQLTEFVYSQRRRDLRNVDLGTFYREQCLQNWDQIQQMQNQLNN